MIRRTLPQRRAAETFDMRFWNQPFTVTVGFYPDGTLGEVFVGVGKTGTDIASVVRDAGVVISLALQHGVPVADLRHAVTRDNSGAATSILGVIIDAIATRPFSEGGASDDSNDPRIPPDTRAPAEAPSASHRAGNGTAAGAAAAVPRQQSLASKRHGSRSEETE